MEQMINMSINLHFVMIATTLLLALYILYASYRLKDEMAYINRIQSAQFQYLSLVTAVFFTGVTVMAVNHFVVKPTLVLMILAVLMMYFTSTKLHMRRKSANTKSQESMDDLRRVAVKKYLGDIVLIVLVGGVSLVLR